MNMQWTSIRASLRNLRRDCGGAAMLEVAVVAPVLLTLGLGVIEFGNIIYKTHRMQNAVRDAARYASGLPANCCAADVQKIAARGSLVSGAPLLMTDLPESQISVGYVDVDNSAYTYRGGDKISTVTVSAYIPYTGFGFLGYLQLTPPTLVASHQERVIGLR